MRAAQLAGNASHTAARVAAGLRPQWHRLGNASARSVASATGLARGLWRGALRWCERHELRPRLVGLLTSGQAAGGWVARGALGSLRRLLLLARNGANGGGGASGGGGGGGGGASGASGGSSSEPRRRGARPTGSPSGDSGEQAAQLAQYERVVRTHDHYAVLELSPRCDTRQIKAAFRRLARLLHPDKLGAVRSQLKQPEAAFQRLQEAHEVLSDDGKRATYDLQRQGVYVDGNNHAAAGGGRRGASPYGHSGRASPGAGYAGHAGHAGHAGYAGYAGYGYDGGRHYHQQQSQQHQQQRYDPFASMRFDFEQATRGRRGAGQYRSQSFW